MWADQGSLFRSVRAKINSIALERRSKLTLFWWMKPSYIRIKSFVLNSLFRKKIYWLLLYIMLTSNIWMYWDYNKYTVLIAKCLFYFFVPAHSWLIYTLHTKITKSVDPYLPTSEWLKFNNGNGGLREGNSPLPGLDRLLLEIVLPTEETIRTSLARAARG